MAFFKLILFLHCVGLVQLSSYVGANSVSRCNHTNIMKAYEALLKEHISLIIPTESPRERQNVINCCPKAEGAKKLEALLSCIQNFTGVCIASDHQNIWQQTVSLLKSNCRDYIGPKMDNVWNGTVTYKNSNKCMLQRHKIKANQECGEHTLQELRMMWKYYNEMIE